MTALSTDKSNGAIYSITVEEFPGSSHGTTVTASPTRFAIVHCDLDTQFKTDTLNLNTYVNGTVGEVKGLLYESAASTTLNGSTTWSGTSLTLVGHGAADNSTAKYNVGAIVDLV